MMRSLCGTLPSAPRAEARMIVGKPATAASLGSSRKVYTRGHEEGQSPLSLVLLEFAASRSYGDTQPI